MFFGFSASGSGVAVLASALDEWDCVARDSSASRASYVLAMVYCTICIEALCAKLLIWTRSAGLRRYQD